MGDERLGSGDQHDVEGRPHAGLVGLVLAALEHGLVRGQHGALQELHDAAPPRVGRPPLEQLDLAPRALERAPHGVDRHRRCDLARGVPTHAIGDDEEAVRRLHVGRVFVVLSHDADVCNEPGFECHTRGFVLGSGRHQSP